MQKTITVPVLVETITQLGLKKRHAQKIAWFAIAKKQWILTPQMDIQENEITFEETIAQFMLKQKTLPPVNLTPTFTNTASQKLYELVIQQIKTQQLDTLDENKNVSSNTEEEK